MPSGNKYINLLDTPKCGKLKELGRTKKKAVVAYLKSNPTFAEEP
jgi:hypothetical protein